MSPSGFYDEYDLKQLLGNEFHDWLLDTVKQLVYIIDILLLLSGI